MTLPPLQVFTPGGSAGGTARSPTGPRVTARPVSEGRTRSACRAWGRCRRAGSCPSAGSSPSPVQWPRRAGPRGTRVGGTRQVPRCQLHGSQRCGLCLPPDLQVQQAQTRQAAPRATPGPVTAASGRRREASAPAAAPPPVHGARADVGGRATRHGNCSPVRAETPHIRRRWRCPRTHPRPPKCVPPQSKGCASVPRTPMAQPRTRWGRTHSQRQLTPNAHDVPRVGTRKPKTQSKLSPERRHS